MKRTHVNQAEAAGLIRSGFGRGSERGRTAEDALLHWVTAPPKSLRR